MESNFDNNDFERFLKQNADQYRMFPSENVWEGIHNSLHTRRRWHGLWLALLLLTTGAVTWIMLTTPGSKKDSYIAARQPAPKKQTPVTNIVEPVTPLKTVHSKKAPIASPGNEEKNMFMAVDEWNSPEATPAVTGTDNARAVAMAPMSTMLEKINAGFPVQASPARNPAPVITRTAIRQEEELITGAPALSAPEKIVIPSIAGDLVADPAAVPTSDKQAVTVPEVNREDLLYPLSIESVINSYTAARKVRKAKWQVYVTPTVTYRKLNENKQFINSARSNMSPTSLTYSPDLNNIVTHRPDLGLQLGISMSYPLNRKLSLITGLQFNISKYDIWAYNYPSEIATVALANDYGGTSTVSTVTNYRIVGVNRANKANWLRNFYYSASAPIGLEYKAFKTKRAAVGIAATFQPTYVLGNRAYVISTDYKNYMEVPSLTRKWNINAGFEAFAGFNVGKTSWRIGPQARYQTMSSFKKEYPVQEHLFDYGLKLGIQLNH